MAENQSTQQYPDQKSSPKTASQHVGDVVTLLNMLPPQRAAAIIAELQIERAAEIFDAPELKYADTLLEALPVPTATAVLDKMAPDRAVDILQTLDQPARSRLLNLLSAKRRADLRELLLYAPDTAGGLMTTEFVSVPATWTVDGTLRYVREVGRSHETVYAVYILDPTSRTLLQTASLQGLIAGDPEASVLSVCPDYEPIVVAPMTDREDVAKLIARYDLLAVPVVDKSRRVLGIVTFDDVIDAIIKENTEDVHKMGGVEAIERPYFDIGFLQMTTMRAGWLAALFMGEMLTASAMQHFEAEIANAVVLTLFIPLIMSSGGNSGSQTTSLIIRALALEELQLGQWWRVALREMPTGMALGIILGLIGVARIVLWQKAGFYDYGQHWPLLAGTVGASLVAVVTFGSLVGSMLPFMLKSLRFDPATASAPLVATLVDVSGIVIYFSIALLVLSGTLL